MGECVDSNVEIVKKYYAVFIDKRVWVDGW